MEDTTLRPVPRQLVLLIIATTGGFRYALGTQAMEAQTTRASWAVLTGSIRDTVSGVPVAGVIAFLDGIPRDTSDSLGRYRVEGIALGPHTVRFVHPEFLGAFDGVVFDLSIEVADVAYRLEVPWPSMTALVQSRCDLSSGVRYGAVALIGHLAQGATPSENLQVRIDWSSNSGSGSPSGRPARSRGFSSLVVPVQENGGFLACHLPAGVTIRLQVVQAGGHGTGPPAELRLPIRGMATIPHPLKIP